MPMLFLSLGETAIKLSDGVVLTALHRFGWLVGWFGVKFYPTPTHFGVKLNGINLQGNRMCKGTSTPAIASVKDRKYAIFQEKSNMYSYVSALAKPKLS